MLFIFILSDTDDEMKTMIDTATPPHGLIGTKP
jgi:hypothetical protein